MKRLSVAPLAALFTLGLVGASLAEDPPGSTPSDVGIAAPSAPQVQVPPPARNGGPPSRFDSIAPPDPFRGDDSAESDAALDALLGVIGPEPPVPGGPEGLATAQPPLEEAYIEQCSWHGPSTTNPHGYAECFVYDCDSFTCEALGSYCVDKYNNQVPCG